MKYTLVALVLLMAVAFAFVSNPTVGSVTGTSPYGVGTFATLSTNTPTVQTGQLLQIDLAVTQPGWCGNEQYPVSWGSKNSVFTTPVRETLTVPRSTGFASKTYTLTALQPGTDEICVAVTHQCSGTQSVNCLTLNAVPANQPVAVTVQPTVQPYYPITLPTPVPTAAPTVQTPVNPSLTPTLAPTVQPVSTTPTETLQTGFVASINQFFTALLAWLNSLVNQ